MNDETTTPSRPLIGDIVHYTIVGNHCYNHLPPCRPATVTAVQDARQRSMCVHGVGGVTWETHVPEGDPGQPATWHTANSPQCLEFLNTWAQESGSPFGQRDGD